MYEPQDWYRISCRKSYRTQSKKYLDELITMPADSSTSFNSSSDSRKDNSSLYNWSTDRFPNDEVKTTSTPYGQQCSSSYSEIYPDLSSISNDHLNITSDEKFKSTSTPNLYLLHEKETLEKKIKGTRQQQVPKKDEFTLNFKAIILVLIAGIAAIIGYTLQNSNFKTIIDINIKSLQEKYPKQSNDTWENFEAVINDILIINPSHPAVFLLLYTKQSEQINNLVHHLAEYASMKLNTNNNYYIDVNQQEFHRSEAVADYGYLIAKYEQDLIEKKVMVVKDLQDVPGKVAQAFHTLCDEISPLVEQVVYIFTLKVDSMQGKAEDIAETYLKRFWNDLDNDVLIPLITRVTSTVLKIIN